MKIDVILLTKIIKEANINTNKLEINTVVRHLENNTEEHIIYKYADKDYMAAVIKYFEEIENYKKCKSLYYLVDTYNKLHGENIKTKL
jgi:hypothetical protein